MWTDSVRIKNGRTENSDFSPKWAYCLNILIKLTTQTMCSLIICLSEE